MNITSKHKRGFSLIELMVVIAIIAILTAIVTTNFAQSKAKARDAKRASDLAQLQLSFALFFDRCNGYPLPQGATSFDGTSAITTSFTNASCPTGITLGSYMSVIPSPPVGIGADYYRYVSNGYDYILSTSFEKRNSALDDDVDGSPYISGQGWAEIVECDDAEPNFYYCVKPN